MFLKYKSNVKVLLNPSNVFNGLEGGQGQISSLK